MLSIFFNSIYIACDVLRKIKFHLWGAFSLHGKVFRSEIAKIFNFIVNYHRLKSLSSLPSPVFFPPFGRQIDVNRKHHFLKIQSEVRFLVSQKIQEVVFISYGLLHVLTVRCENSFNSFSFLSTARSILFYCTFGQLFIHRICQNYFLKRYLQCPDIFSLN